MSPFVRHKAVTVLIPAQRRGWVSRDILRWQLFLAWDDSFCFSCFVSGLRSGLAEAGEQLVDPSKAWVNWLAEVRSFWMFTEESLCHWQSRWQRWLCVPFCRPTWKWQFASDLNIFKHFASMSGFGQKNTCTCAKLANLVSGLLPPWSHDGFHLYSSFSDYSHRNKSDHSRTI